MHLTTAQSSAIVAAIFFGFCLIELARTRLFAKDEQSRHDGIIEIISTFTLLIVTQLDKEWEVRIAMDDPAGRRRARPSILSAL